MLPVYSGKSVKVAFGSKNISSIMDISFSRNEDETDEETGMQGDLSVSRMSDKTGTCTINIMQQGFTNKLLAGIVEDQDAQDTLHIANLTITTPSGSVLADLGSAYIKKTPEVSFSKTAAGSYRSWVFYVEKLRFTANPQGDDDNPLVKAAKASIYAGIESFKASARDALNDPVGG